MRWTWIVLLVFVWTCIVATVRVSVTAARQFCGRGGSAEVYGYDGAWSQIIRLRLVGDSAYGDGCAPEGEARMRARMTLLRAGVGA